jgi:lysophospholipase L1-like esterase
VNADGVYSENYTDDGLHPNEEGYKKITEILLPVITEKLK